MRALTVVILLVATTARADPPPKLPGAKSEQVAVRLAAGGAILTTGLILASFLVNLDEFEPHKPTLYAGIGTSIITPSLGQLYAGQYLTIGMGIRGAAAALAIYGLTRKQDQPCALDPTTNCPTVTGGGLTLVSLAAIAYIGGIAYDVRDASHAVKRYNAKLGRTKGASLVPTRSGVALVGYF